MVIIYLFILVAESVAGDRKFRYLVNQVRRRKMSNDIFVKIENIENETTLTGEQEVLELIIDQ